MLAIKSTRRAALLAAAGTAALMAQPAFAQTAQPAAAAQTVATSQPAPAAEGEVQTVVVRGARPIAESDRAALQVQRNSPALVSVLSADEAGRLADQNIAFAIGRLPGIGVERDQGQARYVNLRGAPRRWVNTSFDGINIVSPEGRDSRFDNIPSAIASQVIVNKAVTPDMSGDTVAGNVNVRTRSAFDYPGRKVTGGVQLGYVGLGGGEENDISLVVSDRFADDTFGLLAQVSYYRRNMVTDNWETDPYLRPGGTLSGATSASGSPDRRPGSETRRWAREYENKPYRLTRGNISGSLRADWRPDDANRMWIQTVYTQYTDDELRSNYIFRFDTGATTVTGACPATPAAQTTSGAYDICNGNSPTNGTVFGVVMNQNFNSLATKEYIWTSTLGGEHEIAEWNVSWRLNYTQTDDGRDAGALPNFTNNDASIPLADRPTVEYDFRDPNANTVRLFRTIVSPTGVRSRGDRVQSIEAFPTIFQNISYRDGSDFTDAWTGKVDVTRDFNAFGGEAIAKFGLAYTTRTKQSSELVWRADAARLRSLGLRLPTYADFALQRSYLGDLQLGYSFQYHSQSKLETYMRQLIRDRVALPQDTTGAYYRVTEDVAAAYAMATVKYDWGSVVFGVRAEQTENTGEAFSSLGLVQTSSDELAFYPSLHINYDWRENVKLRLGFTSGASRPDFDELAPNFSVSDQTQSISGGNPEAGPERAWGVDAYLEWYIQPQGYFSFGVFYKDISDALFTQIGTFGSDVLDTPGFDRSGYTFSTLRNGGSGFIRGFEISYNQFAEQLVQSMGGPAWMEGFGVRANLTVNDTEVTIPTANPNAQGAIAARTQSLPGASDLIYNLSLVYEKYGLSMRLAYQWRKAWVQGFGSYLTVNGRVVPDGNGDTYWDDDDELDFSARYQLNENLQLTFDVANILDGAGRRYVDSTEFPVEYEKFGTRYLVGVRFNF